MLAMITDRPHTLHAAAATALLLLLACAIPHTGAVQVLLLLHHVLCRVKLVS
jgi:hypothetical protein